MCDYVRLCVYCVYSCHPFSSYSTPLQLAVTSENHAVFQVLLGVKDIHLDVQNSSSHTALWLALQIETPIGIYDDDSFAGQIVKRGGSTNTVNTETGTCFHWSERIS